MTDAFMQAAIEEAERGRTEGGIPIGSVLVHDGRILGRGRNRRVQRGSPVLHAEMDALENAGRLRTVGRPSDRLTADFQLVTGIRRFEVNASGPAPIALLEISARIVSDKTGTVVAARVFRAEAPMAAVNGPAASAALNQAFGQLLPDLVRWVTGAV